MNVTLVILVYGISKHYHYYLHIWFQLCFPHDTNVCLLQECVCYKDSRKLMIPSQCNRESKAEVLLLFHRRSFYCLSQPLLNCKVKAVKNIEIYSPVGWYPSCLQATAASLLSQEPPQTVPHTLFRHTSSLPSSWLGPPTILSVALGQFEEETLWSTHVQWQKCNSSVTPVLNVFFFYMSVKLSIWNGVHMHSLNLGILGKHLEM